MSFIKPAKSCPHLLKITLWKKLGHLVQKYMIAILKNIFPNMLSNTSLYLIESNIENLRLQECSLKNRSLWKLVVLLETYMKQRQ